MKAKKKLTAAQMRAKKQAKAERQKKYEWIFINGKQVRVKRPETIDGMSVEEFIVENADDIWLHQNERWDLLHAREMKRLVKIVETDKQENDDNDIPFWVFAAQA